MPGGNIVHYTGVRLRVIGSGSLLMQYQSLDAVNTVTLIPFTLHETSAVEPFRLSNFMSQRMMFKVSVNVENDWFSINRISVFMKPTFTSYPG